MVTLDRSGVCVCVSARGLSLSFRPCEKEEENAPATWGRGRDSNTMGLCASSSGMEDRFEAAVQPMRAMLGKLKVGDEEARKIYAKFEA